MSEYQYYEFQAIDRALTDQEQDEVARISSRVDLSPYRAAFTYNYGDFRGDPIKVLAKYFDAMLYITNWGSRWLYFRMPRTLVTPKALAPYCVQDVVFTSRTGGHVLLGIRQDEEGGDWIDGEGELDPLIPLRQQILEGDYRALYLAWLMANEFADEMEEEDRLEPPVPAGLRNLSKPLKAFVEFFGIDDDLITVAAKASPKSEPEASLESWIPRLAASERKEFLRRLVRGDSSVPRQLRLRLTEIGRQQASAATRQAPPRRSAAELVRRARQLEEERAGRTQRAREAARPRTRTR